MADIKDRSKALTEELNSVVFNQDRAPCEPCSSSEKHVSEPRPHLRMSSVGHPCRRYIWHEFNNRLEMKPTPQVSIKLEMGKRLEDLVIDVLKGFHANDEFAHEQGAAWIDNFPSPKPPFVVTGKYDVGTYSMKYSECDRTIIEIKCISNSTFNYIKKRGLIWGSNMYYRQLLFYVGSIIRLEGPYDWDGLFVALNRDTGEFYAEFIEYDDTYFHQCLDDLISIVYSYKDRVPLIKDAFRSMYCKNCQYRHDCYKEDEDKPSWLSN